MSSNRAEEDPSDPSEHSSGPGLIEWADRHRSLVQDQEHIELPFLSPYSSNFHAPFTSQTDAYSSSAQAPYASQAGAYFNSAQTNSYYNGQSNDYALPRTEPDYTSRFTAINFRPSFAPQISYPQQNQLSSPAAEGSSSLVRNGSQPSNSLGAGAAAYAASLAAVNGVTIPSKRGHGQRPLRPSGIQPIMSNSRRYSCPVCGTIYERKNEVRSHFVACINRNGNPDGARWTDGLYWDAEEDDGEEEEEEEDGEEEEEDNDEEEEEEDDDDDDDYDAGAPQNPKRSQPRHANFPQQPTNQPSAAPDTRSARTRKMDAALDAVNGIVIPSRLGPGQPPKTVRSLAFPSSVLRFSCPICDSWYPKRAHVKSHFPACVKRNGNPNGYRYDEGDAE